jgi:hypothetical protein
MLSNSARFSVVCFTTACFRFSLNVSKCRQYQTAMNSNTDGQNFRRNWQNFLTFPLNFTTCRWIKQISFRRFPICSNVLWKHEANFHSYRSFLVWLLGKGLELRFQMILLTFHSPSIRWYLKKTLLLDASTSTQFARTSHLVADIRRLSFGSGSGKNARRTAILLGTIMSCDLNCDFGKLLLIWWFSVAASSAAVFGEPKF